MALLRLLERADAAGREALDRESRRVADSPAGTVLRDEHFEWELALDCDAGAQTRVRKGALRPRAKGRGARKRIRTE